MAHADLAGNWLRVPYEGPDRTQYSDAYFVDPNHILTETTSNPSKVTDPIKLEQQKVSAIQALVRTIRAH